MANDPKSVTGGRFANPGDQFTLTGDTPDVHFDMAETQPPSMAYVGVNDKLLISAVTNQNSQFLTINVLMLRPDGQIVPMKFSMVAPLGRAEQRLVVQLMEGFILSATVMGSNIGGNAQLSFVTLSLVRQPFTDSDQYHVLFRGYVHDLYGVGYPQDVPQRMTDGAGTFNSNQVANPVAGADFIYTVPTGARQRLVGITGALTTSAAVANRLPTLIIDDGANTLFTIPTGVTQAASLTDTFVYGDSLPVIALANGVAVLPLPSNLFLRAGWRVRSSTAAIQAADQWSLISLTLMDWLEAF